MALKSKEQADYASLCQKFDVVPTVIRVTNASNTAGAVPLNSGRYRIFSTVDCYFAQANGGVEAAALNSHPMPALLVDYMTVTSTGPVNVAVIGEKNAGYFYISKQV